MGVVYRCLFVCLFPGRIVGLVYYSIDKARVYVVYYESRKRELKRRLIYWYR
jgi:hypothetical protein